MGEAKRKQEKLLNGPCLCGKPTQAKLCCFDGKDFHKKPEDLKLKALPPASAIEKCYMKELGSCEGPISGEHLISASVIEILKGETDFSISGTPWLKPGEEKIIGANSLVANCLCKKHNSVLSPLDNAARHFLSTLKSFLEHDIGSRRAVVSGHDLERWLLKTAKAMAASKNFASGQIRFEGAFAKDTDILEMLDDPTSWHDGAGLYGIMSDGETTVNFPRFQVQPLTNDQEEIEGIIVSIIGLRFVLLLRPQDISKNIFLRYAQYRPGEIIIANRRSISRIKLSWEDNKDHLKLNVKFVQDLDIKQATAAK